MTEILHHHFDIIFYVWAGVLIIPISICWYTWHFSVVRKVCQKQNREFIPGKVKIQSGDLKMMGSEIKTEMQRILICLVAIAALLLIMIPLGIWNSVSHHA